MENAYAKRSRFVAFDLDEVVRSPLSFMLICLGRIDDFIPVHNGFWTRIPEGARVVSCDGKSAYETGKARIGSRFGRWELASQRRILSGLVFVDVGDPYAEPITECTFETGTA